MNKNNKTKDLIFKTAIELLQENGNLILKNISDKAKVNIAAINYYYGDKDTLLKEIIVYELTILKTNVSKYLDMFNEFNENPEESMCKILTYLYDYSIENLGILKFIFSANNKQITEEAIYLYIHEITLDTEFMDKVMVFINTISPFYTMDKYKIKYTQLLSTFAFPLVVELDLLKIDIAYFTSIKDVRFRENYIKQLCKTFFED